MSPDPPTPQITAAPHQATAPSASAVHTRFPSHTTEPVPVQHFGLQHLLVTPPPAAIPAILCYLALRAREKRLLPLLGIADDDLDEGNLINMSLGASERHDAFVAYPRETEGSSRFRDKSIPPTRSERWECQWYRCLSVFGGVSAVTSGSGGAGLGSDNLVASGTYRPGSIEGVWEGVFTVSFSFSHLLKDTL